MGTLNDISKWLLGIASAVAALIVVALLVWIFSSVQTLQLQETALQIQVSAWEKAEVELRDALNKEAEAVDKASSILTRLRMDLCRTKDGHTCD